MAGIQVAVINESTVLSDEAVSLAIPALQIQVHNHFAPAWGIDADLAFVPKGSVLPPGAWWLTILDDSDQAEAVGYHELTPEGRPLGKVFARSAKDAGIPWTVTVSHELLEMLADPNAHLAVFVQPHAYASFLYAYEICDPCEAREYWYTVHTGVHQVQVSDFVFPAWCEPVPTGATPRFDYGGHITAPCQCLPGCHVDVYDVWYSTSPPYLGEGKPSGYEVPSRYGSRRARRGGSRHRWRRSRILRAHAEIPGVPRSIAEQANETLQKLSSDLQELQAALTRFGV
jgi:hypothetical protein